MAADPETGIITDEQLTKVAGQDNSDPAVAEQFLAREAAGHATDGTGAAGQDNSDPAVAEQFPAREAAGHATDGTGAAGQGPGCRGQRRQRRRP